VVAQHAQRLGHGIRLGRHHTAIAIAPQVFAREETEGANVAHRASLATTHMRAKGLSAILDQLEPMLLRQVQQRLNVGGLAKQVHRQQGLGLGRDGLGHLVHVDVQGLWINVHKHRLGTDIGDRFGGCDEGERCRDHLVTRANARRQHGQMQRIGAVGAGDGVLDAQVLGRFGLEGLHIGTQDVLGCVERGRHRGLDLGLEVAVLARQVNHGNAHGKSF